MIIGLMYLSLILLFVGFIVWIFFRRPTYTHERFAFTFIGSIILFSAVSIIPLLAGESLLFMLTTVLAGLLGYEAPNSSNVFDKVLSVIILAILGYIGIRLHSQMVGLTTDRKYQAARRGRETGILSDALAELKAKKSGVPLPLAAEREKSSLSIHVDMKHSVDWKSRALRLLLAYSNQFQIDPKLDWIEEVQSFFCSYGKMQVKAIVYCPSIGHAEKGFVRLALECKAQSFWPKKFVVISEGDFSKTEDAKSLGLPQPEIYSEDTILEQIADFAAYRRHIVQKFEKDILSTSSGLTLQDTYTSLSGLNAAGEIQDLEEYIRDWSNEVSSKHLAILGEYGQGKSTFVTKIAYNYFKFGIGSRIPVIIELRGRSPRSEEIEQLVFPWCNRFGVSPSALLALHSAGKILLILDGFDEMDHVGDAEVRLSHMKKLWQFSGFEKAKILLTGRPNFFFDTSERERALLVRDELDRRPYCEPIRLVQLSNDRAKNAIRKFPSDVVEGISKALSSDTISSSLQELLLRPSTLIWAATVWDTLNVAEKGAPILSASVLRRFIKQANDRQTLKGLNTILLASERQYLNTAVALEIHERASGTNQISSIQLHSIIEMCVDAMPDVLREFLEAGEEGKLPVRKRFQDRQRLVDSILTETRAGGIIVEDVSKPNTLRFAHKSFYEYLVGEALAVSRSKAVVREMQHYYVTNDLKQTSYGSIEAGIEGLRQVDISLPSTSFYNGYEVAQFAGETMVNICVEIMKLSGSISQFESEHKEDVLRITRRVWLGYRTSLLSAAFVVDDKAQEIYLSSIGRIIMVIKILLIDGPMFASRNYAILAWSLGAKGLGFRLKQPMSKSRFKVFREIARMSSPG